MDFENKTYPKLSQAMAKVGAEFPGEMEKSFPRILSRIEFFWGEKEAIKYLDSLLLEDRKGRQGFPLKVIRELGLIKQTHDFLYPTLDTTPLDPFSAIGISTPAKFQHADQIEFESSRLQDIQTGNIEEMHGVSSPLPEIEEMGGKLNTGIMQKMSAKVDWPTVSTLRDLYDSADLRNSGVNIYTLQGRQIGEILMHYGRINEQSLRVVSRMKERAEHTDKPLGQILVEIGVIGQQELDRSLCIQTGLNMVDILSLSIPSEILDLVPAEVAREKQVVPVGSYRSTLFLACSDPISFKDGPYFTVLTGLKVQPVYAPRHEIINRLNMYGMARNPGEVGDLASNPPDSMPDNAVHEVAEFSTAVSGNDATIINLVNKLIQDAVSEGVSDIHIESFRRNDESGIRFRRDGHLENFSTFPGAFHAAVVSRIKIMAGLDILECRRPQDGKISFDMLNGEGHADLRVSIIPVIRGNEFVTIRILASAEPLPFTDLGLADRDMNVLRELFHHSFGLILVCGPAGSGKTTTLHSVLQELNTGESKIWTVEDPVQIVQSHLCQVQINKEAGVTFANILRSFLRADPDVIMIGELRDQETAKIALEASLTGHLTLSTLHTNSASESVARLVDLNVDPYNLSDALLAILAQRLVRKLCPACAKRVEASPKELEELANEYYMSSHDKLPSRMEREKIISGWQQTWGKDEKIYLSHPIGCKSCSGGYKGRIGLFELLQATPQVRHLIGHRSYASEYKKASVAEGMKTLKQDGIEKIIQGITDLAQVHIACA